MTGLSSIWHRMPQSRAILARLEEAEFVRVKELAIPADRDAFHPLTDRAGRALDRLDALRSEATSKEIGFTFASTQAPYDGERCRAWVALNTAAPTVFEVLRDEFAARLRAERQRDVLARSLPRVTMPVDVTDARMFPEINAAAEWARTRPDLQAEWDA